MEVVMKVGMFLPKQNEMLLMVILPTIQKILLTVSPDINPLNLSVSRTVPQAKVLLISLY